MYIYTQYYILFLVTLCCGACVQLEAEIPEVCYREDDLAISGVTDVIDNPTLTALLSDRTLQQLQDNPPINPITGRPINEISLSTKFQRTNLKEISDSIDTFDPDASIKFLYVELTAGENIIDLSMLEGIELNMKPLTPMPNLPEVMLVSCRNNVNCNTQTVMLVLPSGIDRNLIDYFEADTLEFDLIFDGTLPFSNWTVHVAVCFSAKANYNEGI